MSEMPQYIPGVPCWVDTLQTDPVAATAFYGELFDWTFTGPGPMPEGGNYFVAQLKGRDVAGLASLPPDVPQPVWTAYVLVDDLDAACKRARAAKGIVLAPPTDVGPAGAFAVFCDPTGGIIGAWRARERSGAQAVNEPSAWTMNQLTTSDTQSAATFYRAVFGWEVEPFGPGGAMLLFRLPGYVGGVPQQPVPRDVVAVMAEAHGAGANAAAYWSVDFRVGNVDETVERTARLGGAFVVPAFNTPFSRNAVLRDPQGAVFSIHSV
jgi:uncharacterized protein